LPRVSGDEEPVPWGKPLPLTQTDLQIERSLLKDLDNSNLPPI
jgi:hypothetical protein